MSQQYVSNILQTSLQDLLIKVDIRHGGYKTFFMLNSTAVNK